MIENKVEYFDIECSYFNEAMMKESRSNKSLGLKVTIEKKTTSDEKYTRFKYKPSCKYRSFQNDSIGGCWECEGEHLCIVESFTKIIDAQ